MAGWAVNVDGVGRVIARTGQVADEVTGAIGTGAVALQSAATSSGSALVGAALAGYATDRADEFRFAVGRPAGMLQAAVAVVGTLLAADADMAASTPPAAPMSTGVRRAGPGWRLW